MTRYLYVWRPQGHGQLSFFVVEWNEAAERKRVEAEIARLRALPCGDMGWIMGYEVQGWGTDYYQLEVYQAGQVVTHEDDWSCNNGEPD